MKYLQAPPMVAQASLFETPRFSINRRPLIVHHGGGVNSTAMLVGMKILGITPDLILFADTGGEKPETYSFLDTLNQWLSSSNFPRITVVRYNSLKDNTLEDECLRLSVMPSKVYGMKNCSQKWKIDPQDRYVRKWRPALSAWEAGSTVVGAVGFDAGEERRVRSSHDPRIENWYPLIEWGWGRSECLIAIESTGLPRPPKSACFFCPSSRKPEVIQLATSHPALYARSLAIEQSALSKKNEEGESVVRSIEGLGRHWSWESLVGGKQAAIAAPESMDIECACFDGEDDEA